MKLVIFLIGILLSNIAFTCTNLIDLNNAIKAINKDDSARGICESSECFCYQDIYWEAAEIVDEVDTFGNQTGKKILQNNPTKLAAYQLKVEQDKIKDEQRPIKIKQIKDSIVSKGGQNLTAVELKVFMNMPVTDEELGL